MTANPERVMDVLADVVGRPQSEWQARLTALCGADTDLHQQVSALVEAHAAAAVAYPESACAEQVGDRIGSHRLLERLGEGGFGTVWLAEQDTPIRRLVALKVLKWGMDTARIVARFEAERQALALMDHPNIAKVFDGGATAQGRPYFAMELVRGVPITRYCDEARLGTAARLQLFATVCEAVQHAHQKGVIHRDLKPSNVLVAVHDGRPVPKVIDFGIAKATAGHLGGTTEFTGFQQLLGTPEYMAPEQAERSKLDVDTRADIYSLGVMLYELLTGTKPFACDDVLKGGYQELLRHIQHVDPPKPSTRAGVLGNRLMEVCKHRRIHPRAFARAMRGDLDWIVLKAMEKDRSRRYATATALAEDIGRHLRHEVVAAGPPSRVHRLQKYVRRHRIGVAAGGTIALSLAVGLALTNAAYAEARAREVEARREAVKAGRLFDLVQGMLTSSDPHDVKGGDYTVRQLLDDFARDLGEQLASEPEIEAPLLGAIADSYLGLGLPAQAAPHLERALQLVERTAGAQSLPMLQCLRLQARWLHALERHEEALAALARARAIAVALEGRAGLRLAAVIAMQADLHRHLGDLTSAEAFGREAVAMARGLPDAGGEQTASCLSDLALVLVDQGRFAAARALQEEALALVRKQRGDGHASVLERRLALAQTALEEGRHADAAKGFEQLLRDARAQFGDVDPFVANCTARLADARHAQGRYREAEDLHRQALRMRLARLGESHPAVVTSHARLARALAAQRRHAEAEQSQRDALALLARHGGPTHADGAVLRGELGTTLAAAGKPAEAEACYAAAIEQLQQHGAARRGDLADVVECLGRLRDAQGRFADAESLHRRALALRREHFGPEHPAVATSSSNLASALDRLHQHAEAEAQHRHALELKGRVLAADHPSIVLGTNNLALCLLAQGRYAEAEALQRRVVAAERAGIGENPERLAASLDNLGGTLVNLRRYEEAEQVQREAVALVEPLGPESPELSTHLANLAMTLHLRGDQVAAEQLLRRALELQLRHAGEDHPLVAVNRGNLALVLACRNEMAAVDEIVARVRRRHGTDSLEVAALLARLARTLLERQQAAAAEPFARECLQIRERKATGQWPHHAAMALLGRALVDQDRADAGEPLLLAACTQMQPPSAGLEFSRNCLRSLIQLYERMGRPGDAEAWRRRLTTLAAATPVEQRR